MCEAVGESGSRAAGGVGGGAREATGRGMWLRTKRGTAPGGLVKGGVDECRAEEAYD